MVKSIRIVIGGKEYTLKGDDEKIIESAAQEVNRQIEELQSRHHEESASTLAVLAALNIAEESFKNKYQMEIDDSYVIAQLGDMKTALDAELKNCKEYVQI
jgi:cell division protein ZapA (FtsZ GTPase activity inhibitor)